MQWNLPSNGDASRCHLESEHYQLLRQHAPVGRDGVAERYQRYISLMRKIDAAWHQRNNTEVETSGDGEVNPASSPEPWWVVMGSNRVLSRS